MASTTTLAFTDVSLFANETRNRETLSTAEAMLGERFSEEFQAAGIEPVLTDVHRADEAAARYARGDLPHVPDRVHIGGGRH